MSIIRGFFQKRVTVLVVLVGLSVATGCAKKPMSFNLSQVKSAGVGSANGTVAQSHAWTGADSQATDQFGRVVGKDADSQATDRFGRVVEKDADSRVTDQFGQIAGRVTEETLTEGEAASPFAGLGTTPRSGSKVASTDFSSGELSDFAPGKEDDLQVAKMLPFQATFELGDVHFQFDKYSMDEASRLTLQENARWLKQHPGVNLEIQGHADDRGTSNYNLGLGERRAQMVKKYLTALGVAEARLFTVSYGEEKPFCLEDNENCWWQNRRGHFMVSGIRSVRGDVIGMLP